MSSSNSGEDLESISTLLPLTTPPLPTQPAPSLTADVPLFCYDYRTSIEAIHEAVYRNGVADEGSEVDQRSDTASFCTTLDDCSPSADSVIHSLDPNDLDMGSVSSNHTLSGGGKKTLQRQMTPKQATSRREHGSPLTTLKSPSQLVVARETSRDIFKAHKTYADVKRRPALPSATSKFSLENVKLPNLSPKAHDPRSGLASKLVPTREIVVLLKREDLNDISLSNGGGERKVFLKPMPPQFTYTPPHLIAFKYKRGEGIEQFRFDIASVFQVVTALNEFSLTLTPDSSIKIDDCVVKMITFRLNALSDDHEMTLKQINRVWSNLHPDPRILVGRPVKTLTCLEYVANHNRKDKKVPPSSRKLESSPTPHIHYAPVVKQLNYNPSPLPRANPLYGKRVVAVAVSKLDSPSRVPINIDPLIAKSKYFKTSLFATSVPLPDTIKYTKATTLKEITPAKFYSSPAFKPFDMRVNLLKLDVIPTYKSSQVCLRTPLIVQSPDRRDHKVGNYNGDDDNEINSPKRGYETFTEPEGGLVLGQGKIKRLSTIGKSYRETDLEAAGSLVTLASGTHKSPNHFFFTLNLPKHTKVLRYRPKSPHTVIPVQEAGPQPAASSLDAIDLTYGDVCCLEENEFLNDTIIDFYLKYLWYEKLEPSLRNRVHIFTSFFYSRMTSRLKPPPSQEKSGPIDDFLIIAPSPSTSRPVDNDKRDSTCQTSTISVEKLQSVIDLAPGSIKSQPAQDPDLPATALGVRLHQPVKKWTKNVDIFSKRFLVIPINKDSHWFVAIIYFENSPDKPTPDPSLPHTHIIILDSLATHHYQVPRNIRAYLTEEWREKKGGGSVEEIIFDCTNTRSIHPRIPQQTNYHDCGPYLLHYVEVFFANMQDFEADDSCSTTTQRIKKHFGSPAWSFLPIHVKDKRKLIVDLIIKLRLKATTNGKPDDFSEIPSSTIPQLLDPKSIT